MPSNRRLAISLVRHLLYYFSMFRTSNQKWFIFIIMLILVILLAFVLFRSPKNGKESIDEGPKPRADVLEWIEKHYEQDHKKKVALTRLAEAHQYILTHSDSMMDGSDRDSLAMACYGIAFPTNEKIDGLPPYEALGAESFNTYTRARKRIAYHGRLSGHVFQMPVVRSWDKQCELPFSP